MPSARRGPRAMAAPSSVPPTPANGSRTSSPVRLKNSISRAISRGGLFAPCALPRGVPELRRVGRRQQRLGEVQPLLAGQLVERVGGVGRAAAVGHRSQPSRRRSSQGPRPVLARTVECRHARQVHERAVRGARGGVRPPRRRVSTTLRTDGPGRCSSGAPPGVGVTRFLDEAIARMRALREPMTVLRATAWPAGADEPYGPIIRAIGPALREMPPDVLAESARTGDVRGRPAAARSRAAARPRSARRSTAAGRPPRSVARRGRWRGSSACSVGSASSSRSCSSSRTSTGPMPRPARSSRSWPGSRANSAWRSSAPTSPTSSPATTRGRPTSARSWPARARRSGLTLPPLDRDELAVADRGDRGRTGVGQPPAARRRALRRPAARGRGAAGRPPRAARAPR